ncbi:hypothetical protein LCGC14_2820710, partial [marine sediment metagenome]
VISIEQALKTGPKQFKPEVFIHHVYQMQFGNPYGRSDLRPAHKPWITKKFISRMFAIYLEKFASPTVVGTYPKNMEPNEISDFHDMLKTIQQSSTTVKPESVTIDFQQPGRDASDAYIRALNYYNMQIARSVLVPDLLGVSGSETKSGSSSLGKEQFKLFLGTIKKDRESLARKITQKIIKPLTQANFGDLDIWFDFKPYTHDDVLEYLKVWTDAVKAKIFEANDEEINYLRSATGFPEGDIVRPKKEKPRPPMLPGQMIPGQMPPQPQGDEPKKPDPKGTPEPVDGEEDIDELTKKFAHRALTKFEKKLDFVQINKLLDRNESRMIRSLSPIMKTMASSMVEQVRDKNLLTKFNPERIEQLKPLNQRKMNALLKILFRDLFKESFNQAQKETFPDEKKQFVVI